MKDIDSQVKLHPFIIFSKDHFNPLGMCRSLGERGIYPTVIVVGKESNILKRCKYVRDIHVVPDIETGYKLLTDKFSSCSEKPFLLTSDDDITLYLNDRYDDLIDKFYFFNCQGQGKVAEFMKKDVICDIAESCGIPKPKGEILKKGELPKNLRYPVITKVTMSTKGAWKDDVFICNSEEELKEAYTHIKADELLVQEFIDKKNELCVDGISINGGQEIWFPYTSEYIRFLNKSYGEYMWIKPYDDKQVREQIENIIRRTKFSGIFSLECLIDKEDNLHFLEVNFRNSTWSYAYTWAGLNLPYEWAKGMLTGHFDKESVNIRKEPFRAMNEPSDLINSVFREKQISLWKWIKDVRNCEVLYNYNKKDPKPLLGFIIGRLKTALGR